MVRAVSAGAGIYKPGAGLMRSSSSGSLSGRLGARPDVRKSPGGVMKAGDARNKITQGKILDARDLLGQKAKTMDARQKLEKIRNLRDGNLEVKKVGGITVTKKVGGGIVLSTKTKPAGESGNTQPKLKEVKQIGRLTKTVNSSGQVSLSSKSSQNKMENTARGRPLVSKSATSSRSRSEGGVPSSSSVLRGAGGGQKENRVASRGAQGLSRDIDRLDEELLNTQVDPGLIQRTVETSRRQQLGRRQDSHRSPAGRDRSPIGRRNYDYDDPRATTDRETDLQRRRMREQEREDISVGRTMASRLESSGGLGVSPLQGTKIVIQNLQSSVTQEDILELFGDIGALRRAKLVTPGHAEVTFVNKSDAARAVEIYHNRQLDGKPMKCQMVGAGNTVAPGGATMKLPKELQGSKDRKGPIPDIDSIHRALFNKKNVSGKKQTFTITMPKKSRDEQERW